MSPKQQIEFMLESTTLLTENKLSNDIKKSIFGKRDRICSIHDVDSGMSTCVADAAPTGSGKSFGVKKIFITKKNHDSMIFMSPQKAHLTPDEGIIKLAEEYDVEFRSILSIGDLTDIDFTDWATGIKNGDRLSVWTDIITDKKFYDNNEINDDIRRSAYAVRSTVKLLKELNSIHSPNDEEKEQIDYNEKKLLTAQLSLATSILDGKGETWIDDLFLKNNKTNIAKTLKKGMNNLKSKKPHSTIPYLKADLRAVFQDIIATLFPLNISGLSKKGDHCRYIFLMTTHKFNTRAHFVRYNPTTNSETGEEKGWVRNSANIFSILSGTLEYLNEGASHYIGKPESEIMGFMGVCDKNDKDESTGFPAKIMLQSSSTSPVSDVTFHIVVDEEHISKGIIEMAGVLRLFNDEVRVEHTLAAVGRLYSQYLIEKDFEPEDRTAVYGFINVFINTYNKHCDVSERLSLEEFLNIFMGNNNGTYIKTDGFEQIQHITQNVFSFQQKNHINSDTLKEIFVQPTINGSHCEITKTPSGDKFISLYELYQVIITLIYSLSNSDQGRNKTWSGSGLSEWLRGDYNQNKPLSKLLDKSKNSDIQAYSNIFFGALKGGDVDVDTFYTYFIPKMIFSINWKKELPSPSFLNNVVFCSFKVEFRAALAETKLLQLLSNNKGHCVSLLSATSGIDDDFTGGFNWDFMRKYSKALGYNFITRNSDELNLVTNLQQERKDIRGNIGIDFVDPVDGNSRPEDLIRFLNKHSWLKTALTSYVGGSKVGQKKEEEAHMILMGIMDAVNNNESSLILSRSETFANEIAKKVMLLGSEFKTINKHNKWSTKGDGDSKWNSPRCNFNKNKIRIFEWTPNKDDQVFKVIFFNSAAERDGILDELTIKSKNEKVILISTFQSAATGLNNYLTYDDRNGSDLLSFDFNRLYIAANPYYSNLKDKEGFVTMESLLTLFKRFSHPKHQGSKKLSDFPTNLFSGEHYSILVKQHNYLLLKTLIQAVGRVERCDTPDHNSSISISSDFIDAIRVSAYDLYTNDKNYYSSLSMTNKVLIDKIVGYLKTKTFNNNDEKLKFEQQILNEFHIIDEFIENDIIGCAVEDFKRGITEDNEVHSILMSNEMIFNPISAINKLKKTEFSKSNNFGPIFDMFFLTEDRLKSMNADKVELYLKDDNKGLTDITSKSNSANSNYNPWKYIFPNNYDELFIIHGATGHWQENKKIDDLPLPNPALIPLLKGIAGEWLFVESIRGSIAVNNAVLPNSTYELADFYFVNSKNELCCVDVKNYSMYAEQSNIIYDLFSKAKNKISAIRGIVGDKYNDIKFLYVNTKPNQNSTMTFNEDSGENIYFLNLFKNTPSTIRVEKRDKAGHKMYKNGEPVYDNNKIRYIKNYTLNSTLTNIIQGDSNE